MSEVPRSEPDHPGDSALVLIAVKSARPAETDEWRRTLASIVAAAGGTLWELANAPAPGGPGPGHSHVVRLDSMAALHAYELAISTSREAGTLTTGHGEIRRDVWRRHGAGSFEPGDHDLSALLAAEVLCTDPAAADEWDRWYDEQHLPDMMQSGAFVAGSRWRRDPRRPGGANDLTLYEIADHTVEEAISMSAAVMPGLIAAGRKHPCHCGGPTMALSRAA